MLAISGRTSQRETGEEGNGCREGDAADKGGRECRIGMGGRNTGEPLVVSAPVCTWGIDIRAWNVVLLSVLRCQGPRGSAAARGETLLLCKSCREGPKADQSLFRVGVSP